MPNPSEDELLAELGKLEKSTIRKGGDALQSASHDGGFATEGTNIQSKAKAMKKAIKEMMKGGMSKEAAEDVARKAFADADSDSDDDAVKGLGDDDDSMSADDNSGDDESSDGDADAESAEGPITKSTGAAQLANASQQRRKNEDTIRKALVDENPEAGAAFDAAPILGQLIDSIDRLAKKQSGISKRDLGDIRKSVLHVENTQRDFNGKLAKALTLMAGRVIATEEMVKKMYNEPLNTQRAPTLKKGDLHEPHFHNNDQTKVGGNGGVGEQSPLLGIEMLKIQEALVDICQKGGADVLDITKFENSKGNLNVLPPNVLKQLEARFSVAA